MTELSEDSKPIAMLFSMATSSTHTDLVCLIHSPLIIYILREALYWSVPGISHVALQHNRQSMLNDWFTLYAGWISQLGFQLHVRFSLLWLLIASLSVCAVGLSVNSRVLCSVQGLAADVGCTVTLGDPKWPVGVIVWALKTVSKRGSFWTRTAHHAFMDGGILVWNIE